MVRLDSTVKQSGQASGTVVATLTEALAQNGSESSEEFATIMQNVKADSYRGKRIRFSAYVKGREIGNWAGLWMRVDGSDGGILSFDNMQERPIKGMVDWARYEVILDVPEPSVLIAFGLLLSGTGQAWLDDVQIEVVGTEVASTGQAMAGRPGFAADEVYAKQLPEILKETPAEPINLDFEKE